ncbi:M23 family metallopeptidase [Mycolicibacterium sp. 3033]|nr:M23 family metallopeptidase [Mycolicibacterium aurantiacum]
MRMLAALLLCASIAAGAAQAPAAADGTRLQWPLRPRPPVVRAFDAPDRNWQRGHRGVDLAASQGQVVYAAAGGTVVFAGQLAGRPVVSIAHPGGLRTSYEPVQATVRPGQTVGEGSAIGALQAGHAGCAAVACLHWGAMWGPAARADYVDPVALVVTTPILLKPLR